MNWIKNLFNTDEIAEEIIEKSTSNQETISALQTEVSRLQAELNAKSVHANDVSNKLVKTRNKLDETRKAIRYQVTENKRIQKNYEELKKKNAVDRSSLEWHESMMLKMDREIYEKDEYIKVIETLASKKSDKKEFNENFASNLQSFIDKTGLSLLELERVTDVNRTTIRELLTFKTNLTYDSLAGLSDVMCEYFGCMPADLVKGRVEK